MQPTGHTIRAVADEHGRTMAWAEPLHEIPVVNRAVVSRLEGYAHALRLMRSDVDKAHWVLMELRARIGELTVVGFKLEQRAEAEA